MAYGTRWYSLQAAECISRAEKRALLPGRVWGLGFLYRFEEHTYAQSSGWDDDTWYTVGPYLELIAYLIRSKTPKGHTIHADNGLGWRFISLESNKQFALPTIELALESYIARKKRQHAIYQGRANRAQQMVEEATKALENILGKVGSPSNSLLIP
jgi:hypothetical protein